MLSLTLALSRWEREQPLNIFLKFKRNRAEGSVGFAKTRRMFLPLPAGEGRGEGERFADTERPQFYLNRSN